MTTLYTIVVVVAIITLIALMLPCKVVVTLNANVAMHPEAVIALVASTEGFQTFNPIFRIFGLFMDHMLGKTYERCLKNTKALA